MLLAQNSGRTDEPGYGDLKEATLCCEPILGLRRFSIQSYFSFERIRIRKLLTGSLTEGMGERTDCFTPCGQVHIGGGSRHGQSTHLQAVVTPENTDNSLLSS